ncbi:D-alanyl-D-alanine carboxypeptidase family protein [Candidatus Poribacteria bacterium]|nr:D-alanyl-D-alanine carboxypeptidase family protein [Candidatus Poribacteria bacterium]
MYIYDRKISDSQRRRRFSLEGLGQAPISWMDTPEQRTFLERVLAAHIARSTQRKGSPLPDLPAANVSPVPGTKIAMRTDASIVAGTLLSAANLALVAAKAAGDRDALKTIRISATSGYRSRTRQEQLWRNYFQGYYNETAATRAKLPGGAHGDEAVNYMVRYVSPKIAAPGFSNHQAGLAIDFWQERTKGNEIRNSTRPKWVSAWQNTWFFSRWLTANAARFGFYPYVDEPWHWEYRPAQPSSYPAIPSPVAPAQPSSRQTAAIDVERAMQANRYYAKKLGWQAHYDRINPLLGFTNYSPDERTFAEAVANWQRSQGLTGDGIIGPNTWARMKTAIGLIQPPAGVLPKPSVPATPPVPVSVPAGVPPLGGPKVPPGFKPVERRGVVRGLALYGGDRLDRKLLSLKIQGIISVSNEDIDTFQRIANVETRGLVQAINTWDSAVVSSGFMQWTLQHGKLQEWIKMAEAAFQRYGIELDNRTYKWYDTKGNVTGTQQAIKGAATKDELRWNGWAERFFWAGLDTEIIVAEVKLAVLWLQRHITSFKKRLNSADFAVFKAHYDSSLQIRGIFQSAYNNLPVAAINGTTNALRSAKAAGGVSTERFLKILQDEILKAYIARGDDGTRIITETRIGIQTS